MFPIQMTFTVSTPGELAKLIAVANGGAMAATEVAANTAANVAKAETAKKAPKAAAAASAPPAATQATQATTGAASGGEIDFTSQIQKPIVAMAATGAEGRAKALAILKELGAARASDIKPEDYAKAVELIAKAG